MADAPHHAARRAGAYEVRPAHGGARDARVVAAAAVLLHLHRRRRRRDRRAALGDSERARRLRHARRKSLIAADVLISTNRDWTPEARQIIDRRLTEAGADAADRNDRDADDGAAGRYDAGSSRGWWSCGPCSPRFRSTARSSSTAARLFARAAREPRRARPAGAADGAGRRRSAIRSSSGRPTFTIRGVITNEPGRRVGDFSLGPRVLIDYARPAGDRPAHASAAAPGACCWCACPKTQIEPLVDDAARRLQGRVRQRPLVPRDRRRDRRRLRSRGELSEPGRPGHRDPRRHRGVERDARLRAAEDAQHRRAEVRRRAQRARSSPSTCCR